MEVNCHFTLVTGTRVGPRSSQLMAYVYTE
jgi:hypothetical protein